MRDIGRRLKSLRSYLGYRQNFIASSIGISQAAYSKMESGLIPITKDKLEAIAKVMGTTVDEITSFAISKPYVNGKRNKVQDPQEEYIISSVLNDTKMQIELLKKEVAALQAENQLLKETIQDKNSIIELLKKKEQLTS